MTPVVIPPKVLELLKAGNKIEAIKELRGMTGLGLKVSAAVNRPCPRPSRTTRNAIRMRPSRSPRAWSMR